MILDHILVKYGHIYDYLLVIIWSTSTLILWIAHVSFPAMLVSDLPAVCNVHGSWRTAIVCESIVATFWPKVLHHLSDVICEQFPLNAGRTASKKTDQILPSTKLSEHNWSWISAKVWSIADLPPKYSFIVLSYWARRCFATILRRCGSTGIFFIHLINLFTVCSNMDRRPESLQWVVCFEDLSSLPQLGHIFFTDGS